MKWMRSFKRLLTWYGIIQGERRFNMFKYDSISY